MKIAVQHLPKALRGQELICLSISDTGTGMSPAVSERIFEPFYTTKSASEGTGMGLAMVFGFVVQCGGHIRVSSQVGEGTTFYIYLPTTREPSQMIFKAYRALPSHNRHRFTRFYAASPTSVMTKRKADWQDGNEVERTFLLVDDHADIRFIAKTYLELAGHQVFEAANPTDAIAWLSNATQPFS